MVSKRDKKQDVSPSSVNWLDQLAQELNIGKAPEGWFTISQICEKLGRNRCFVERILKEKGAEKRLFISISSDRKQFRAVHYKL
jgi:hypothetical protein